MNDLTQMILFVALVLAAAVPLGWVAHGLLTGWRLPGEAWLFRLAGVDPNQEYDWRRYALAVLLLNGVGLLFVLLLAAVVLLVGALTFLPALVLGPVVAHLGAPVS